MGLNKNGCREKTLVCIMKVRTFRVALCNNQLLLFPQDQFVQEISVACLLFLEMTATLWQPLYNTCSVLFKMLGCCFMNVLWLSGARVFMLCFLLLLTCPFPFQPWTLLLECHSLGAMVSPSFSAIALGWGLRKKGNEQKSLMVPA